MVKVNETGRQGGCGCREEGHSYCFSFNNSKEILIHKIKVI